MVKSTGGFETNTTYEKNGYDMENLTKTQRTNDRNGQRIQTRHPIITGRESLGSLR